MRSSRTASSARPRAAFLTVGTPPREANRSDQSERSERLRRLRSGGHKNGINLLQPEVTASSGEAGDVVRESVSPLHDPCERHGQISWELWND